MVASVKCHSDQGQSTTIVTRVIQSGSMMAIWPQLQPSLSRFSEDGFGSYWWLSVTTYIAIAIWRQFLPLSAHVLSWTMHYWLKISKERSNFWIFARNSFSVDPTTKKHLDRLVQNLIGNKKVFLTFVARRQPKRVICKKPPENFWKFSKSNNAYTKTWNRRLDCILHTVVIAVT